MSDEILSSALVPSVPQLEELNLSETAVTTRGVLALRGLSRLTALDLTYCPLVSYAAVMALRDASPRLALIRRQPPWLDGHFDTPWGETHTYYPCGAFSFTRATEAVYILYRARSIAGGLHGGMVGAVVPLMRSRRPHMHPPRRTTTIGARSQR